MKKTLIAVALGALFAGLAGCQKDAKPEPKGEQVKKADPAPTAAPAAQPAAAQPAAAQPAAAQPAAAQPAAAQPAAAQPAAAQGGSAAGVPPTATAVVAAQAPPKAATPPPTAQPVQAPPAAGDIPAPDDVAAAPADAEATESGIKSKVLTKGTGAEKPGNTDKVTVHYTGWTTDGKMFDSSVKRGEPATFGLNQVIPGWTEGVGLMVVGEKRRLWIPEALAYKGRPGAPQGMLVFDVELFKIEKAPEPPPVPTDVAAPPADAEKTESGISSKVLTKGTGTVKPLPTDNVEVHYSGWTTDGKMFDSSVSRGRPATFPLDRVIPGWTEGVGLMVVGEKRRLWIPEALAYKGRPGAPQGMLVFDVELLSIKGK